MNLETRLTRIEKAASEKSAAPCHCGAGPIVCRPQGWDGEAVLPAAAETVCARCGGERPVIQVVFGERP